MDRIRRWCLGLVATALLAAGCAGSGSSPQTGALPRTATRLTIALPRDFGPLNIFATSEDGIIELVYDKLLAPSPFVREPRPWLAQSVTAIDHSTWEVKLRDGVRWHDGQPFDAGDVAFTVEYFKRSPSGRWTHHVSEVPEIARVEVLDPLRLRMICAYPCPELGPITLADLPIIPEHVWRTVSQPRQRTELPVGTGPYRLAEYDARAGYRFVANPDYFAGRPRVEELRMPVIADPSTTFTALRTGEIDAAARPLPPELLDEFRRTATVELLTTAPLQFPELRLNFERPPFSDAEVRRALSLAVDRRELVETVLLGQGRAATKGYPHPDSPWTNPNLSTPSDPAAARALLDGLGIRDGDADGIRELPGGRPFAFTIQVSGSEPVHVRAAEALVGQLGKVGIAATVRAVDAGTIEGLFRSRAYEAYIDTIGPHGVADPTQFIMSHRSGYLWDAPEIAYPAWDVLYERWRRASDVAERTRVSFEMQELFNRQPTSIPLYYPDVRYAVRRAAYDGWAESPGYGIVHKWSFLPRDVSAAAGAIVPRRD